MYRLIGLFLLPVLTTVEAKKQTPENVVELQKLLQINSLSYTDFHKLNAAHIIYNFYKGRAGGKVYFKSFHDLHYAGNIAIGDPGQILNVIFDIGTADVLVMSAAHCDNLFSRLFTYMCWTRRYFDETKSYKDSEMKQYVWTETTYPLFQIKYEKATVQGILLYERVKVGNIESPPQLIGLMDDWKYGFAYSKADGIVGLGPRQLSNFLNGKWLTRTHKDDKKRVYTHLTLREQLVNKGATKFAFHLFTNAAGKEGGHLIVGADDEKESWRMKTDLMWVNMARSKTQISSRGGYESRSFKRIASKKLGFPGLSTVETDLRKTSTTGSLMTEERHDMDIEWSQPKKEVSSQVKVSALDAEHWSIPLTTIKIIGMADGELGGVTFDSIYTVLDPGTSVFAGPEDLIYQLNDQIFMGLKRAKFHEGSMEFDCRYRDQLPIITFIINNRGFLLEPKDYVKQLKHSCSTGFMAMGELPFFIIGDSFFRRYYTVFDFAQNRIGFSEIKTSPV